MIIHTVLLVIFMALLIREDMARFEIDFAALAMVALNGAALNIHLGLAPLEMALGALIWSGAALVVRLVCGRNRLGQGDVYLFAVIGLIAGSHVAAVVAAVIFVSLGLITSWAYARARGRKMARSLTPAALPGGLTITLILMGRMVEMSLFDGFEPADASNTAIGHILTWGPWVAVALALCAAGLMIMDRKTRGRRNQDRGAQHG